MAPTGKKAKKTFLHMKMNVRTLFCGVGRGNLRKNFSENCCIVKDHIAWKVGEGWWCSASSADVFRYLPGEAEEPHKALRVYLGLHLTYQQHT